MLDIQVCGYCGKALAVCAATPDQHEIAALKKENGQLKDRVADLEETLGHYEKLGVPGFGKLAQSALKGFPNAD